MKRAGGALLGLLSLGVVAFLAVTGGDSEPDMDRESYEKGYHAFSDAWLPPSDEQRRVSEARCEEMWGAFPSSELDGVNKDDWVAGCADYVEGKDSRF